MKRIAAVAAVALSSLAVAGCGGSSDAGSPAVTDGVVHEAPAAAATATEAGDAAAPRTTVTEPTPPATADEDGSGPAEVARKIAAAYERQDWPTFCEFYGRDALEQLRAGAAASGTAGGTCPEILRGVFGNGMVVEPLDVSGDAAVDGDRATVGELSLVREGGEWKLVDSP